MLLYETQFLVGKEELKVGEFVIRADKVMFGSSVEMKPTLLGCGILGICQQLVNNILLFCLALKKDEFHNSPGCW